MPDEMSILRTLHRMHRQVADLQGQLDRIPRQRKTAQVLVDQASQALADTKDRIKQKKMEADRKQLQLREREAKLQQLEDNWAAAAEAKGLKNAKGVLAEFRAEIAKAK